MSGTAALNQFQPNDTTTLQVGRGREGRGGEERRGEERGGDERGGEGMRREERRGDERRNCHYYVPDTLIAYWYEGIKSLMPRNESHYALEQLKGQTTLSIISIP